MVKKHWTTAGNELFECVWPFCGVGAWRVNDQVLLSKKLQKPVNFENENFYEGRIKMLLIKLIAKKFIGCFLYQIPKNFMIYAREKEGFSWFLKRVSGTKHRKKKSRKNNNISLCSLLPLSSYIFVIFYR